MKKEVQNNYVHNIVTSPKNRVEVFRDVPVNKQGFILFSLSKKFKEEILRKLKNREVLALLHYVDPDEATDLLQLMPKHRSRQVLGKLNESIRNKVEFLLKFNPRTAAGIMSVDYVEVDEDFTFEQVAKIVKKHETRTGKFPAVMVVCDGFLIGEVSGSIFALCRPKEKIKKYVRRLPSVKYNVDENDVLTLFKRNEHKRIAVLDEDNSIMGVIYADDVLRLVERKSASRLYDFAGVSQEEDVLDSFLFKVKNRYKWLIINLATAFLAASVVGLFKDTISAFVMLAMYMPIVAGMGGNAATQTLAVVVRGIALKEISFKTGGRVVRNEVFAGAVNGCIVGVLVAIVASLFNQSPLLGLVIGVSMVVNLVIAGLFGTVIPLIMKGLGKDPATSAAVFITTATDVFGFFVFLGLATVVLV